LRPLPPKQKDNSTPWPPSQTPFHKIETSKDRHHKQFNNIRQHSLLVIILSQRLFILKIKTSLSPVKHGLRRIPDHVRPTSRNIRYPSYDHFRLQQTASYLALLGDIGHVGDERLFAFLEKQLERYWVVYFLLGNHEPYHLSLAIAKAKVNMFAEKMKRLNAKSTIGKFVFLDQTRHDLTGKLTILGCTLFSKVTDDQEDAVAARLVD
jgi:hypothetical protein